MPREPKPWYRKDRDAWFVTIRGVRHNLGPNKKQAFATFHELMRKPPESRSPLPANTFAAVADAFLQWMSIHRSPSTYEWYRYRLERYCQRYPDQLVSDIRPFHVQTWVDSYPDFTTTTRRNYLRTVKRCMTWARQQGYIDENPIRDLEVPGATAKEVFISGEEFERACGLIRDRDFLELCRVTFEVGCRPQEILRIEARHCDFKNSRWVLPPSEAKGKRKPRIIYLTPRALDVSLRLAEKYPIGRLFRNSKDKPWTMASVNCGFSRLRARMGRHAIMEQGLDIQELMAAELRLTRPELKGPKDLSQSERNKLRNTVAARHATRLSLYALRHSWATNALQSGLDSLTVAVLMGHSDPSTLARVYQHLSLNPRHLLDEAHKVRHD